MKKIYLLLGFIAIANLMAAQNVGIGTTAPQSKLHVKGTVDFSQFIIDAHSTQGNENPLIKLRKSNGTDLMWIHSDDSTNVFLGLQAGRVNDAAVGGLYNSFIGSKAGYSNTIGSENTATGYLALFTNSAGIQNTAIGLASLFSNTTASANTAIGTRALSTQSFDNGGVPWESDNVAVGFEALLNNQPTSTANGGSNTAIGTFAMLGNIIGYANTAVGASSLFSNTNGTFNTAMGINALYNNLSGSSNTAIGSRALQFTTSDYNTAVGASALRLNNIGYYNTAIGSEALNSNGTGNDNTASGYGALYYNSTGYENTATGSEALYYNTTGRGNTASGIGALHENTTGNYNTALGYAAGPNVETLSNTISIGNGAAATANNQIVLGTTDNSSLVCYAAFNGTSSAAANLIVTSTGQILRSVSSRRYKKDILPLEINTANIYQLRPVSYNSYTDDIRHFGLIAEEVADVIPELASYSREKDVINGSTNDKLIPDAVQYPLLSVLLLNEVQKHEQTINESKATITGMKNLLAAQQTMIGEQNKKIEMLLKEIQKINDKLK